MNLSAQGLCLAGVAGVQLNKHEPVLVIIHVPRRDLDPHDPRPGDDLVLFEIRARVTLEKDPENNLVHLSLLLPDLDNKRETRTWIRRWHNLTGGLFEAHRPTATRGEREIVTSGQLVRKAFEVLSQGKYSSFFDANLGLDMDIVRDPFTASNDLLMAAPFLGHLSYCKGKDRSILVCFLRAYRHAYFGHQIGVMFDQPKPAPDSGEQGNAPEQKEIELERKTGPEKWWIYLHGFGTTQLLGKEDDRFCVGYLNAGTGWMTAAHDSFVYRCKARGFRQDPEEAARARADTFRADAVNTIIPVPEQWGFPMVKQRGRYVREHITPDNIVLPRKEAMLSRCFAEWDAAVGTYAPLYRQAFDLVGDDLDRYHLMEIREEFKAAKLLRSRSTLTVVRDGVLVLWGNLEQASPSLNATGLFDCIKFFYPANVLAAREDEAWLDGPELTGEVMREAHALLVDLALRKLQKMPWTDTDRVARSSRPTALNLLQDCVHKKRSWLPRNLCEALAESGLLPLPAASDTPPDKEPKVDKGAKAGIIWVIRQSLVPDFLEHVAAATCPKERL